MAGDGAQLLSRPLPPPPSPRLLLASGRARVLSPPVSGGRLAAMARARSLSLAAAILLIAAAAAAREAANQDMHPRNKEGRTLELGPTRTTRRSLLPTSTDGTCGPFVNLQCNDTACCSNVNKCGKTADYCGVGCQKEYGICVLTPPTAFNYEGFNASLPPIMQGSTAIVGSSLQLTDMNQYVVGNAFHPAPVTLLRKSTTGDCQAASFTASFSFLIFNTNNGCDGDGLTFTFVASNADLSNISLVKGGSLGYTYGDTTVPSANVGSIAVAFDTYPNPEYNEPDGRHVAILEKWSPSVVTQQSTSALDHLWENSTKYAWVHYFGDTSKWSIYLSDVDSPPHNPVVTYTESLCSILRPLGCTACANVTAAYVGFTAATGLCYDIHQILSWSFESSWTGGCAGLTNAFSYFNYSDSPGSDYGAYYVADNVQCLSLCNSDCFCLGFSMYFSTQENVSRLVCSLKTDVSNQQSSTSAVKLYTRVPTPSSGGECAGLADTFTLSNNTNSNGNDYTNVTVVTDEDCIPLCASDCSCLGFATRLVEDRLECYLKTNVTNTKSAESVKLYVRDIAVPPPPPPSPSPPPPLKTTVAAPPESVPPPPPSLNKIVPPPESLPPPPPSSNEIAAGGKKSSQNLVPIVVPAAIAVGLISVAALLVFIWWLRRKKRASRDSYKGMQGDTPSPRGRLARGAGKGIIQLPGGHLIQALTLEEVAAATSNFSNENKLGKGGYGTVYRGTAPDGSVWAVKRALRVNDGAADAEFEDEVNLIAPMAHRNLVSLKGFCAQKGEQILIYEFVANGTLKQHLMLDPNLGGVPLSFSQRLEIAVGSARGLQYLHSFAKEPVIHRDIKSENILLDANLQAKVADFGLLKPLNEEATHVSTRVAGTIGYMDPEYRHLHRVSTKSDVYSFGVVLLELITGKKPVVMADRPTEIEQTVEHITLVQWVNLQAQAGNWTAIVDPLLKEDYPLEGAKRFIQLARLCTQLESRVRPSMQEVTRILEEIISGGAVDWEKDIGTIPNQRIPFPYQQGSGSIATTSSESFIPPLSQRPGIR